MRDNHIVSVTPSSFSALPKRITSGKHAGLMTLKDEEAWRGGSPPTSPEAARAPVGLAALQHHVLCGARAHRTRRRSASRPPTLTPAQRDLLWQLVETYSVEHVVPALAAAQKDRVRSGDRDAVHFAWYGPNTPEKAFGYRVIGDGFVIEMGSVDEAAQHLHTIYHDLGNVLGRVA